MTIEVFGDSPQATRAGRRALGIAASCPASSTQFEILRATVWGMAAPNGAVHINRVLAAALPAWRLLAERSTASDETLRADLRAALVALESAGDLLRLPGGYWGPATTRIVKFPVEAGRLLVGGLPSSLLPINPDAVQYQGPHRHLMELAPELDAALPKEDLASWSRRPGAPLQEWACEVIESSERQPYTPTNSETFEFYTPTSAQPAAPQFRRWSDSPGPKTATMLARRMRIYGAREYRLVDVRAERVVGVCDLQGVDVRRLMYALDLAAKNPVRARRLSRERAEWLFMSELPRAEQRTFVTCGTLTIPEERPFERRWTFARNEDLALGMLRELGITLENRA